MIPISTIEIKNNFMASILSEAREYAKMLERNYGDPHLITHKFNERFSSLKGRMTPRYDSLLYHKRGKFRIKFYFPSSFKQDPTKITSIVKMYNLTAKRKGYFYVINDKNKEVAEVGPYSIAVNPDLEYADKLLQQIADEVFESKLE